MPVENGLTQAEIMVLVHDYIGTSGGYLDGFSYTTHEEFYPRYCDVYIDVKALRAENGTTRATFLHILRTADPSLQAKIVEGTLAFLPVDSTTGEARDRREKAKAKLVAAVARIRGSAVPDADLAVTNDTVEHALADAEVLCREKGNTSGIDRIHTAFHAYLKALCVKYGIVLPPDTPDITKLFKLLRESVPALQPGPARGADIDSILRSMANIVDKLNPIRNNASRAHPNDELLDVPESSLFINSVKTLLHYLNAKLT